MGVAQKDCSNIKRWILVHRKVRWNDVWAINIELRHKPEMYKIMDASRIPILQEFFIEEAIFAEVLTEIQEDAFALVLQIKLVASYAIGSIIDPTFRSFSSSRNNFCIPVPTTVESSSAVRSDSR